MIFELSLIRLVLAALSGIYLFRNLFGYFKAAEHKSLFKFLIELFVWGGIFIFSISPNLARQLSLKSGVGENLNTFIFVGFFIVFVLIFKMLSKIERIEEEITKLVRDRAVSKIKDKNKSK